VLLGLYRATESGTLTPEKIHLFLQQADTGAPDDTAPADLHSIIIRTPGRTITPRGVNQTHYLQNIIKHDLSFGVGPAGTGKTYLAVACAVQALEQEKVSRLVLVRPAVEAGERLGFLPGDMTQKVDPYLRPLYDALYEMLGIERVAKLIERNVIEVAPLAFMRGRSLNDAFIILDEAQNTTVEQMKMFLTRIGFGSTAVVTGDITQIDLPKRTESGLRQAADVLKQQHGISFTFFASRDVVRHPLVQQIISAYEHYDRANQDKT
jgi:phosphate starvation-inducible PhoH-like protein